jgi:hypothetical protein
MKTWLVVGLAVALSGPVLAGEAVADEWKETLDLVNVQTKATLGIVADPTQGLAAANDRIDLMASAVADTNKAVSEVAASVERLRGPANLVWVSPTWMETPAEIVGLPVIVTALVTILNTGNETAHVGCLFFDGNGTLLLDRAESRTIARGAQASCDSLPVPSHDEPGSGWLIVHSDRPILVDGTYRSYTTVTDHLERHHMPFFPVDCSSPSGIEFVCDLVNP